MDKEKVKRTYNNKVHTKFFFYRWGLEYKAVLPIDYKDRKFKGCKATV